MQTNARAINPEQHRDDLVNAMSLLVTVARVEPTKPMASFTGDLIWLLMSCGALDMVRNGAVIPGSVIEPAVLAEAKQQTLKLFDDTRRSLAILEDFYRTV